MSLLRRRMMMKKNNNEILPKEYQRVEWVGSQLLTRQGINSEFIPDSSSGLYIDFEYITFNSTWFIGSRTENEENRFVVGAGDYFPRKIMLGFGGYWSSNVPILGRHIVETNFFNDGYFKIDGEKTQILGNVSAPWSGQGIPAYILIQNLNNSDRARSSVVNIYRCKFSRGGILERDLVPCYRKSDGEIGFYDLCGSISSATGTPFYKTIYDTPIPNKGEDV